MRHCNDIELLAQLRGRTTDLGYPCSGSPVVRRRRALIDALVGRASGGHFGHSRGQGVISWVFLTKTAKSQFCSHVKRRKRSTAFPTAITFSKENKPTPFTRRAKSRQRRRLPRRVRWGVAPPLRRPPVQGGQDVLRRNGQALE